MKRRLKGEEERGAGREREEKGEEGSGGWDVEMVKDQDTVGVEDGK